MALPNTSLAVFCPLQFHVLDHVNCYLVKRERDGGGLTRRGARGDPGGSSAVYLEDNINDFVLNKLPVKRVVGSLVEALKKKTRER